MSFVAHGRGRRRVCHAAPLSAQRQSRGRPLLRHLNGQRIFERVLVTAVLAAGQMAGGPSRHAASSAAVAAAGVRGFHRRADAALRARARRRGPPRGDLDPAFALVWAVGIACALGAAYQAKFHRLAALILLGGAGLVTCISFVWLSAPDLALTQLVVETVTTVLLLLGPAMAAQTHRGDRARGTATGTIRWYRRPPTSRSQSAPERGWRRLPIAAMTRPAPDSISQYFVRERLHGRRRHQHRERHSGRLPRLRYARRDHGARRCRADRLRPVAAVPSGPRKHPGSRTAARPERRTTTRLRIARKATPIKDIMAVPALIMGLLFPVIGVVRRVPAPAGPRPARGAALLPASRWRSRSSCNTWPAGRLGGGASAMSSRCAGWASVSCSRAAPAPPPGFSAAPS